MNSEILLETIRTKMPFGKYQGRVIADLPIEYLEWFNRKGGLPKGKLGMLMSTVYEIKLNGLENIIQQLKQIEQSKTSGQQDK